MATSEIIISEAAEADMEMVAEFMRSEDPGKNISSGYLRWWFSGSPPSTIYIARINEKIEGMACTKNFLLQLNGKVIQAAMPQKVLTAAGIRKQGLFSKLYYATEKANREHGDTIFLTITNAASTPIFLNKFGYKQGVSPVIAIIPTILSLLKKNTFASVEPSAVTLPDKFFQWDNAIIKDATYFRWRYLNKDDEKQVILRENQSGLLVFLRIKKYHHIKSAFLLDHSASLTRIQIQSVCRWLISRGIVLFYMLSPGDDIPFIHLKTKRFNFLVKGRTDDETRLLASTSFRLNFGELDFV